MNTDEFAPLATESEAHAEWHRNAGVPMGTAGCPQDACHPADDYDEAEDGVTIKCGHCHDYHYGDRGWVIAGIKACGRANG